MASGNPERAQSGLGLCRLACGMGLCALLLAACGSGSDAPADSALVLPPAPRLSRSADPQAAAGAASPGFTPLPTPQQVLAPLASGRPDPFAPLAAASGSAGITPTAEPPGLRFTGVIRSGGRSQALVQLGDQSGTVCVGRRGYCPGSGQPALLPPGWTVTGIDANQGRLVLNLAGQRRVFSL